MAGVWSDMVVGLCVCTYVSRLAGSSERVAFKHGQAVHIISRHRSLFAFLHTLSLQPTFYLLHSSISFIMKLTLFLTTLVALLLATTATSSVLANPASAGDVDLAARFQADEKFRTEIQNGGMDTLKSVEGVCAFAGVDGVAVKDDVAVKDNTDVKGVDVQVKKLDVNDNDKSVNKATATSADASADDYPRKVRDALKFIWCQQCRDKFEACMDVRLPFPFLSFPFTLLAS